VTATPETDADLSPLAMARRLVDSIPALARYIKHDELGAYIDHAGDRAFSAAQLAAHLAIVSLAEDVHTITQVLTGADQRLGREEP